MLPDRWDLSVMSRIAIPESGSRWDTARRVDRRSKLSILPSQTLCSTVQVVREPRPTNAFRRFAPP